MPDQHHERGGERPHVFRQGTPEPENRAGTDPRTGPENRVAEMQALEEVLLETAETYLADEVDEGLESRLRAVAKHHQNAVLVLEPIAVDLVEVVLRERLGNAIPSPGLWRMLSGIVAQTLWDDEDSRTRLDRLWHRLSKAAS